jgi:5-methyltetrahydrofolate--homocysteine methyltransferase
MRGLLGRLKADEILVADGATGTNLQLQGLPAGTSPEDWVFDAPDKILELETDFVNAGADIILTCTFGGSRIAMRRSKHADQVVELNRRAGELARRAASVRGDVLVAGSMGPLGQLLQPYGPIAVQEAVGAYAEQARALAEGGVDLLLIETQFSIEEGLAAFQGARSATDMPVVVSFSYDRGTRTMMGVRPEKVARAFRDQGAALIGVNCGTTLENAETILREYATAIPGYPLWAKPNAGLPHMEGGKNVYDVSPEGLAQFGGQAVQIGARIVGGCCGSTPEHVHALATTLKGRAP